MTRPYKNERDAVLIYELQKRGYKVVQELEKYQIFEEEAKKSGLGGFNFGHREAQNPEEN